MYKNVDQDQRGAVAMITVIFVAILLTVITTSFIRLAINEQREATDDDLTTRAFYAAESGVQDAITAIKTDTVSEAENCAPASGASEGNLSDELGTEYTCQTIDLSPSDYQAELGENQSVFFILDSGSNDIESFTISWHEYGDGNNGTDTVHRPSGSNDLPPTAEWWGDFSDPANLKDPFPAMLRLQILEVPDGAVTREDIDEGNNVVFLNPVDGVDAPLSLSAPSFDTGTIQEAHCDTSASANLESGDYVCQMKISGLDDTANTYYLRLRALYGATNLKVVASDGTNSVSLVGAQAVIDVTGRAGDVFRRIEQRLDLKSNDLWPDFAIISADDICKNFVITDTANDPTHSDSIVDFEEANPGIVGSCN